MNQNQLVAIPPSHNNNLLWNYGHCIVTQHLLSYGLCGMPLEIPMDVVDKYRKGSSPRNQKLEISELETLQRIGVELLAKTEQTYQSGGFENFKSYTTSYGVELNSIEEALQFNNLHEALHLGYAMALRKFVIEK
jgi:hypothetical protein